METIKLTDEQRAELKKLQALDKAEQEAKKEERKTLKEITNETVQEAFHIFEETSDVLSRTKTKVFGMFSDIIELKKQVYNLSDEQYSHTFTTDNGRYRIIIGYNVIDNFDDSHIAGVDGVNKFLSGLVDDKKSEMLVRMAKKLLSRDAKGTLNARKVMQLLQMAKESGYDEFIESVQIIIEAYKPIKTKLYMRAAYRDDKTNSWKNLPLGVTEAEIP